MSDTKIRRHVREAALEKEAHIVICTRSLPMHNIGGMEVVAWELAKQFVKDGVRVTVLTTSLPGRPEVFMEEGVEIVALHDTPSAKYSKAWWKKSREFFTDNLIDTATGVLSVSAAAYGILSLKAKFSGIPFVFQAHGTSTGEIISKWRTLQPKAILSSLRNAIWLVKDIRAYRSFDAIVAVGDTVNKDLQRPPVAWCLAPDKIRLIPNGIDTTLFMPNQEVRRNIREGLGIAPSEHVVVSVSRLHRQKGLEHSLRGFALYSKADPLARYVIVGDGPEKEYLTKLAAELGITDRICLTGFISREHIPNYLAAGDIFLFTTTHVEGLPLNVLEALALGLPAVVSKHLNSVLKINEYIEGVDPFDPGSVAAGCKIALSKSGGKTSLLPQLYSLPVCAKQYYNIFGINT